MRHSLRRRQAFGLLCWLLPVACGTSTANPTGSGNFGKLREDAVVLIKGDKTDEEAAFLCRLFPAECAEAHISVVDVAREGSHVYVLVNLQAFPTLLVSEDSGETWSTHPLPPSYDTVEGIEDGTPGSYVLYPWQGRLYLLVAAVTFTARAPYWVVGEVDLSSDSYSLRENRLAGALMHFESGGVLQAVSASGSMNDASLEYGNVYWNRYDFPSDTFTGLGEIQLAGSGLAPRGWLSVDGNELVALSYGQRQNLPAQLCRVGIDTSTGGSSLSSACLSSVRVPLGAPERAQPYAHGGDVGWLTELGGHTLLTHLEPAGDRATATTIDLGPGELTRDSLASIHPRLGDYIAITNNDSDPTSVPRLVHVSNQGEVSRVELPLTPCEDAGPCGSGTRSVFSIRWILPMDDGTQLVFHVVNQPAWGTGELLVMTRDRGQLTPAEFEPLELGALPGLPGVRPAPHPVAQCLRATSCGYHANLAACQEYWSEVRYGVGGADTEYAAFLGAAAGDCTVFADVYTDVRLPVDDITPCTPGCDGDWATFSCQPIRENCAARGVPCRLDSMGRGQCADRELTESNCNTCDGNVAINCTDSPMPRMTDCDLSGTQCHVFLNSNGNRAICSPRTCETGGSSCVGEVRTYCPPADLAVLSEYDCWRMTETAQCATAASCIIYSTGQLCEDGILLYDIGSNPRMVDCRDLGFSACLAVPNGGPGLEQVHCVP